MREGAGIALIVSGTGLGLLVTFRPRPRLGGKLALVLLACSGATVGLGAALLVEDATTGETVLAALACAALVPINVRLVFKGDGPFRT